MGGARGTHLDRAAGTARARARELFLDESHELGCAETTFQVLTEALGLGERADATAAMALNGGIAYSGGPCGAITGAAVAVGLAMGQRMPDRAAAKTRAREITAELMDEFQAAFGAIDCRTLIGRSIRTPEEHQAFIEGGTWRDGCMRQIEFVVERAIALSSRGSGDQDARPAQAR